MPIKLYAGLHATDLKLQSCTVEQAVEHFSEAMGVTANLGTLIPADKIALYRCTKVHPKDDGQEPAPSCASTDRIEEGEVIIGIFPNNLFGCQHADDMLGKARHYEQEAIRLDAIRVQQMERIQEMEKQHKLLEEKLLKATSAFHQAQLDRDEATTRLNEYMRLHPAEEREPVSPSTAAASPLPSASPFSEAAPFDSDAQSPPGPATLHLMVPKAAAGSSRAVPRLHLPPTLAPQQQSTGGEDEAGTAPAGGGGDGEGVTVAAAAAAMLHEAGAGRDPAESPEEAQSETTDGIAGSDAHPKPPPAKAKPAAKHTAKSTPPPPPKTKPASATAAKQPPRPSSAAAGKAKPKGKATAEGKRTGGQPRAGSGPGSPSPPSVDHEASEESRKMTGEGDEVPQEAVEKGSGVTEPPAKAAAPLMPSLSYSVGEGAPAPVVHAYVAAGGVTSAGTSQHVPSSAGGVGGHEAIPHEGSITYSPPPHPFVPHFPAGPPPPAMPRSPTSGGIARPAFYSYSPPAYAQFRPPLATGMASPHPFQIAPPHVSGGYAHLQQQPGPPGGQGVPYGQGTNRKVSQPHGR